MSGRRIGASLLGVVTLLPGLAAADRGEEVYNQTCVACHGSDGTGAMPGTPDFRAPDGVLSKPDAVLMDHILNGFQAPDSPMAMPAKGGNPGLSEADVRAVLAYLHREFGSR